LICNRPPSADANYIFNVIAENTKAARASIRAPSSQSSMLMNLVNRRDQAREAVRYFMRVSIQPKENATNVCQPKYQPLSAITELRHDANANPVRLDDRNV
jgi:hypothetical protein